MLNRIDLHIEVTPVSFEQMTADRKAEKSSVIRERVIKAREIQSARFNDINEVFEFIEIWYNRKRRHSYLGYLTTVEYGLNQLLNVA